MSLLPWLLLSNNMNSMVVNAFHPSFLDSKPFGYQPMFIIPLSHNFLLTRSTVLYSPFLPFLEISYSMCILLPQV